MSEVLKLVGGRIKEIRKDRGLSQDQLGEKSGFHFSYIGGVERGERNVSLENLAKIAEALNVSLAQLFLFSRGESNDEKEIVLSEVIGLLQNQDVTNIRMARNVLLEIFSTISEKR